MAIRRLQSPVYAEECIICSSVCEIVIDLLHETLSAYCNQSADGIERLLATTGKFLPK
ncbi:hypothetical protein DPMN_033035 [Dreissena polymorpha]|uniref:Uncharacterized protein n=1 Tax=Dreissena polymorpha TaxID=45954 RepID=A0A9D4RIU3_DREPO|nr:hypothetical protein DPMN_033035 [Dreissena polymorpha]